MKNYIMITKNDILFASTISFSEFNNGILIIDEENNLKKVVHVDDYYINIENGDRIFELDTYDGLICPPVYKNTTYILETYENTDVCDQDLIDAYNAYQCFIQKQQLVKEKKLILFPQERLY